MRTVQPLITEKVFTLKGITRRLTVRLSLSGTYEELSIYHNLLDNFEVGQHLYIKSFFKSIQSEIQSLMDMGKASYSKYSKFIWTLKSKEEQRDFFRHMIKTHLDGEISNDLFLEKVCTRCIFLSDYGNLCVNFPEFQFMAYHIIRFFFLESEMDVRSTFIYKVFSGNDKRFIMDKCVALLCKRESISILELILIFDLPLHAKFNPSLLSIAKSSDYLKQEAYIAPIPIAYIRNIFGDITLDVASSVIAQDNIKAMCYCSKDFSPFSIEWIGNVWVNPPYSTSDGIGILEFVKKAISEILSTGRTTPVNNIFIFLPHETSSFSKDPAEYILMLKDMVCQGRALVYNFNLNFTTCSSGYLDSDTFPKCDAYKHYYLFHLLSKFDDESILRTVSMVKSASVLDLAMKNWCENFVSHSKKLSKEDITNPFEADFAKRYPNKKIPSNLVFYNKLLIRFPFGKRLKDIQRNMLQKHMCHVQLLVDTVLLLDLCIDWYRLPNRQNLRLTVSEFRTTFRYLLGRLDVSKSVSLFYTKDFALEQKYFHSNWDHLLGDSSSTRESLRITNVVTDLSLYDESAQMKLNCELGYSLYLLYKSKSSIDYASIYSEYGFNVIALNDNRSELNETRLGSRIIRKSTNSVDEVSSLAVFAIVDSIISLNAFSSISLRTEFITSKFIYENIQVPLAIDSLLPDQAHYPLLRSEFISAMSNRTDLHNYIQQRYGSSFILINHIEYFEDIFSKFMKLDNFKFTPMYVKYSGIEMWSCYVKKSILAQVVGGAIVFIWPLPKKKSSSYPELKMPLSEYLKDKRSSVLEQSVFLSDADSYTAQVFPSDNHVVEDATAVLFGPIRLLNHACKRHYTVNLIPIHKSSLFVGDNASLYSIEFREDINFNGPAELYPLLWCYNSKSSIQCTFCSILDGSIWVKRPIYYYSEIDVKFKISYLYFQDYFFEKFNMTTPFFTIITKHFLRMLPNSVDFDLSDITDELFRLELINLVTPKRSMSLFEIYFKFISIESAYFICEDQLVEIFAIWMVLIEKAMLLYMKTEDVSQGEKKKEAVVKEPAKKVLNSEKTAKGKQEYDDWASFIYSHKRQD